MDPVIAPKVMIDQNVTSRKNAEASNGMSLRHYNFRFIENLVPFLTDI